MIPTKENSYISFLQINIGRKKTAHDLMFQTAAEKNIDILLISEPNKNKAQKTNDLTDKNIDTQIIILNKKIQITSRGKGTGYNWVEIEDMIIYSCYISPNSKIEEFEQYLQNIEDSIQNKKQKKIIIGGDFNAKSMLWGGKQTDKRGNILEEWMIQNELTTINIGNTPTFRRDNSIVVYRVYNRHYDYK